MARVAWVLLSEKNYGERDLIIHNPITSIILESIDEKYSFMLTFSLMELTISGDYKIDIELGEVGGNVLFEAESILGFHYNPETHFDIFTNEISISDFKFNKEGIHYTKLTIDKEHSQTTYFKVRVEGEKR